MRLDFHTHIIPEDIPGFVEKFWGERCRHMRKYVLVEGIS